MADKKNKDIDEQIEKEEKEEEKATDQKEDAADDRVEEDPQEKEVNDKEPKESEEDAAPSDRLPSDDEVSGELIVDVEEKKSYGWLLIVGALLAIVVLVGALLFYYKGIENINLANNQNISPSPTPSVVLSPSPTATPEAKIDREEFGVKVLNGSGVSGQAAAVQEILENAGFKVDEIGNAEESDHKETSISAKKKVAKAFLEELKAELSKTYVLSDEISNITDDDESDVIIIVGSQKTD